MMRSKVECGKLLKKPEVAVMIPKVLLLEAHNGGSYDFFQELSKIAELHFESKEGRYMEWELMEMMGPYDAIMITSQHDISSQVIDSAPKLKCECCRAYNYAYVMSRKENNFTNEPLKKRRLEVP